MNVLLVYDTVEGNTEKVARAMASALAPAEVKLVRPGEAASLDLKSFKLVIIGSPTLGGRPTQPMQAFLAGISADSLKGIDAAAFDTRLTAGWVKVFGFASARIAKLVEGKGARMAAPPEGFFVTGNKGPLKDGELERVADWVKTALVGGS
jgi:flavodoxin